LVFRWDDQDVKHQIPLDPGKRQYKRLEQGKTSGQKGEWKRFKAHFRPKKKPGQEEKKDGNWGGKNLVCP